MSKHILFTATIVLLAGASSFAQKNSSGGTQATKNEVKFLEDISVSAVPTQTKVNDPKAVFAEPVFASSIKNTSRESNKPVSIENAAGIQFKYALLLDTEVEEISNLALFKLIDEWFGTRYRLGGSSKDGIDCSALMQTFFSTLFSIAIPRTAREQYYASKRISRAELREGDLVFFNTIGGISHVGMYLQNNKFVHASSGGGVMVSDLFDEYWMKKFIGAGRIENQSSSATQP